jgi:hypothetical protein
MQKYYTTAIRDTDYPLSAPVYLAVEVDARIAELEKVLRAIANMDQADLSIEDKYESCLYAARSAVLSL